MVSEVPILSECILFTVLFTSFQMQMHRQTLELAQTPGGAEYGWRSDTRRSYSLGGNVSHVE